MSQMPVAAGDQWSIYPADETLAWIEFIPGWSV